MNHHMTTVRVGSVLVLEDEGLVAMLIEDLLHDLGASDVFVATGVTAAREELSRRSFDFAILDMHLRDGTGGEIADLLADQGTPFMFSSGSGPEVLAEHHRSRLVLDKPFADDDLKAAIMTVLNGSSIATVAPPERVAPVLSSD